MQLFLYYHFIWKNVHNFLFLQCLNIMSLCFVMGGINETDLKKDCSCFDNLSEMLGHGFLGQSFIFDGFLLNICIKGSACFKVDYNECLVQSKELFVVLPKHIFSVVDVSPDFEVRTLFVSLDFVLGMPVIPDFELLKDVSTSPCLSMDNGKEKELMSLYSMIERYRGDEKKYYRQIRTTLALAFMLVAASLHENVERKRKNTGLRAEMLTQSFFDLLLQYRAAERSVSFYADKLCVTPKYLSMTVKQVTKYPVQNWINEVTVIEAKRYIRTTELTIQQISMQLHFPTASSFVRFFRIHAGMTPLEYRRQGME